MRKGRVPLEEGYWREKMVNVSYEKKFIKEETVSSIALFLKRLLRRDIGKKENLVKMIVDEFSYHRVGRRVVEGNTSAIIQHYSLPLRIYPNPQKSRPMSSPIISSQ